MRVSSHRLNIECGRWSRPVATPVNDRKCIFCNNIEDEYHFILECHKYDLLRQQYIPTYYCRRPNMVKFVELLTTENILVIKKLGIFIFKAFELRNTFMMKA